MTTTIALSELRPPVPCAAWSPPSGPIEGEIGRRVASLAPAELRLECRRAGIAPAGLADEALRARLVARLCEPD